MSNQLLPQKTNSIYKDIAAWLLIFGLSTLFEIIFFAWIGHGERIFPIVSDPGIWLVKHLIISLIISFILSDQARRQKISFAILVITGFIFLNYHLYFHPKNGFEAFSEGMGGNLAAIIILPIMYAELLSLVSALLFLIERIIRITSIKILYFLALISTLFPAFVVWNYIIQQPLNRRIAIIYDNYKNNDSHNRSYSASTPSYWHKPTVNNFRWDPVYTKINKNGPQKDIWINTCATYRMSTLGLNVFGKEFSDFCFEVAAYAFNDNSLCQEAGFLADKCRTNFSFKQPDIVQNISTDVCDEVCTTTRQADAIKKCESLQTEADKNWPGINVSSDYYKCKTELKIKGYDKQSDEKGKLEIMDWDIHPLKKNGSYLYLKNTSEDFVSTSHIKVTSCCRAPWFTIGKLETKIISPGQIVGIQIIESETRISDAVTSPSALVRNAGNTGISWSREKSTYSEKIDNIEECKTATRCAKNMAYIKQCNVLHDEKEASQLIFSRSYTSYMKCLDSTTKVKEGDAKIKLIGWDIGSNRPYLMLENISNDNIRTKDITLSLEVMRGASPVKSYVDTIILAHSSANIDIQAYRIQEAKMLLVQYRNQQEPFRMKIYAETKLIGQIPDIDRSNIPSATK